MNNKTSTLVLLLACLALASAHTFVESADGTDLIVTEDATLEELSATVLEEIFKGLKLQAASASNAGTRSCWKDAYGRGVGVPISACGNNLQKDGLLCYPYCKSGFYGVGPVCWQDCPSGFRNDGAYCAKPGSYGRGAGHTSQSTCERKEGKPCEKNGLLWYPKCAENFHNVACCVCSPNCPSGMTDIGVSCQKQSYGRGAGVPLTCKSDQQYDAGLCYPYCNGGFSGVGPVCWENCASDQHECGALCLKESEGCTSTIIGQVSSVVELAVAAAVAVLSPGTSLRPVIQKAIATIFDYAYPICD